MLWHKTQGAGFGAAVSTAIEDVFSTYLYTGNGSTQTITNGIDLAGEGGLVWLKARNLVRDHQLIDTERGVNKNLESNTTDPENSNTSVSSFNSDGFTIGASGSNYNEFPEPYASWTFRKAPRFFDVVTFITTSGSSTPITVSHNLGMVPGCIIVKQTNATSDWFVYHRNLTPNYYLALNSTDFQQNGGTSKFFPAPDDTAFYLGGDFVQNGTYVAYLFAHDPLGPSGDGSDGLIACGSYTGNGASVGPTVTLGWEPQWILIKRASGGTEHWYIFDSMRGMTVGGSDAYLLPASSSEEFSFDGITPTSTGFNASNSFAATNKSGDTYIYIAIRRGPMRQPTSGTEVFAPYQVPSSPSTGAITGFVTDAGFIGDRSGSDKFHWGTRLTGSETLNSTNTNAGSSNANQIWDRMDGWWNTAINNYMTWGFRRAPGFFDVVAYQGNNVAGRTVPHNLDVTPEMMIVKSRQITNSWFIYHKDLGATYAMNFDTSAAFVNTASWNSTAPTDSVFTLGGTGGGTNAATSTFIAYLFATLPGISKVGSYTGNGSSQTINCGFTGGARFILIKRTDSTGEWYVWDTARGIVAANDPFLELNTTDAEVTNVDNIDPASVGFVVNQDSITHPINLSGATYIYLAIA